MIGMKFRPRAMVPKSHWLYPRAKALIHVKISASEKPERSERKTTIGSQTSIWNSRIQTVRISLKFSLVSLVRWASKYLGLRLLCGDALLRDPQ